MKDGNVFKQELLWSFFFNWEVTGHYQLLLAIIWVIPFFKLLHWIICSKNKNIGNIWQEVSCFIYMLWTDIGSCRRSFCLSFLNWEITGPYQFDLISSFLKLFQILLFLNCYTGLSVWKTRSFKTFDKK